MYETELWVSGPVSFPRIRLKGTGSRICIWANNNSCIIFLDPDLDHRNLDFRIRFKTLRNIVQKSRAGEYPAGAPSSLQNVTLQNNFSVGLQDSNRDCHPAPEDWRHRLWEQEEGRRPGRPAGQPAEHDVHGRMKGAPCTLLWCVCLARAYFLC